ncbi:MAG: hypothetical protein JJ920_02640 [Roseitalea sp.]|jgi:hypothetical protein|nr:hypothetical protein [Roseitalea sp.]MBO6723210.1 hypothetical protein [Roseitalea sp.]MBO6741780.1 hypothetical protein [Roseitalea sp.]
MADFSAILKKTLDKMGETTPEMRAKVYDKARQTVQRQIDAMASQPPQAAVDRQFEKLETAIAEIEAGYAVPAQETEADVPPVSEPEVAEPAATAEPAPAPDSEAGPAAMPDDAPEVDPDPEGLPEVAPEPPAGTDPLAVVTDDGMVDDAPRLDASVEPEPTVDDVLSSFDDVGSRQTDTASDDPFALDTPPDGDGVDTLSEESGPEPAMPRTEDHDPLLDFLSEERETIAAVDNDADRAVDALFGDPAADAAPTEPGASGTGEDAGTGRPEAAATSEAAPAPDRPRRGGWLIAAAVLVVLLAGGGYAAYVNQEPLRAFLSGFGSNMSQSGSGEEGDVPVRTVETTQVNADDADTGDDAPAEDTPPETIDAGGGEDDIQKFTQRLTEDGREIDEGPAPGAAAPGEGSSVAGQTAGTEDANPADQDAATSADPPVDADDGVAVGQRTIFYEERTGTQPGTAMQGSTVWSVVQESPGGDLPLEPAIRAQSSIPDLGLALEVTIRRNGDATFPASHIVELFFTVPETFEGRGVADVQRITFKNTEQDPGSALIAVPAPIDTNIFLVALTDADTAVQTNTALMLSQGWVDIPMQYVSGRRALITLEKGAAGDAVFREVFDAWEAAPLADAGGG